MFDVFVMLPNGMPGREWVWVCTTKKADFGEIVAACQVLYPDLIGFSVEPALGDDVEQ